MTSTFRTSPAALAETLARRNALLELITSTAVAANEAKSAEEAVALTLESVAVYTGFPVGHAFLVEPRSRSFVSSRVWRIGDAARFDELRAFTESPSFHAVDGLPGAVLATGAVQWIADAAKDPAFVRARYEGRSTGVASAFAFPVRVGREIVAVLEFFAPEPRARDEELLEVLEIVGAQLGRAVERERAHAALALSEETLRRFLAELPIAIFVVDARGEPVYANHDAVDILGERVVAGVRVSNLPETYHAFVAGTEEVYPSERQPIVRALRGEVGATARDIEIHRPGRVVPIEVWASPVFDDDGKVAFAIAAFRDITARRNLERELAKYTAELKRSNEELDQFASIASHDLQEPLRMVTSYLALIESRYKGKLDADTDEFIHYAVDGAARMSGLLRSLLEVSRLGARPAPLGPVSLDRALDAAIEDLREALRESGARVERSELPEVLGNEARLAQVFQNLIANAVKFRSAQPPVVRVSAERAGDVWVVSVADNGIGIAPEHHERVFQLFARLHPRGSYPGTGIGLTLVSKIVAQHGGRVWIESELGGGATFRFTLQPVPRGDPDG